MLKKCLIDNVFSYTPVQRRSKADPLTPDQVKYILENPHPTGYTYARRQVGVYFVLFFHL